MLVTMSMEEYQNLSESAEKLQKVKKIARNILVEHTQDDWSKVEDLNEALTYDESVALLESILK